LIIAGHGGQDFLKFQDQEELSSQDLADAFQQMYEKKRYKNILFMIDTCQAHSMATRINVPNVVAFSSAQSGEPSYSHHQDDELGKRH
jgi:phosphatidylinositol glycan class K